MNTTTETNTTRLNNRVNQDGTSTSKQKLKVRGSLVGKVKKFFRLKNQVGTSPGTSPVQDLSRQMSRTMTTKEIAKYNNTKISEDNIWGTAKQYKNEPKVGTKRKLVQINKLTKQINYLKTKPDSKEVLIKMEQERRNNVEYIKRYKIYHNILKQLANNTTKSKRNRKELVKAKYEALKSNFKPLTTAEHTARGTELGLGFVLKNPEVISNKILAYAGLSKERGERTILHTELSNVIKSLYNSSKSTENNQVQVGKDVIEKIFTLIVKVYGYVKQMPYAKSSPFVQGIKNGWETYNAQKIRTPTANLIARKIQVETNTVDTLLSNLYKSSKNRTQAHGRKLGENIAQLLLNLQNKNIIRGGKLEKSPPKRIETKYFKHLRQKVFQNKNPTSNFVKSIIYGIKQQPGLLNKLVGKENSKLRQAVNVTLTNEKLKQLQTLLYIISIHKKKTYTNAREAETNGTILGKQIATLLNNYGNILRAKSGTTNVLSNNKQKIVRNYKIGVLHGFKPLILKQMGKSTLTNLIRFGTNKRVVNTVRSMRNNPSKLISSVAKLLGTGVAAAVCHKFIPVLHSKYFYEILIAHAAQVAAQGAQWRWKTLSPEIKCLINQLLSKFSGEIAIRIHDNSFLERPLLLIIALLNAYKRHNPDENHIDLNKAIASLKNVDKLTTSGGRKAGIFMAAVNTVTKEPIKAMRRAVIPNAAIRTYNNRQQFFNDSGLIRYKKYFNAVSGLSTNGNKINVNVALNAIVRPNKNLLKNEKFNPDQEKVKKLLTQDNRKLLLLLQKKANQNRSTIIQAMAPTRIQKLFGYAPNNSTWRNRLGRVFKKKNFKTNNLIKATVAVVKTGKAIPKTVMAGGKIITNAVIAVPKIKVRSRGKKRRTGVD